MCRVNVVVWVVQTRPQMHDLITKLDCFSFCAARTPRFIPEHRDQRSEAEPGHRNLRGIPGAGEAGRDGASRPR